MTPTWAANVGIVLDPEADVPIGVQLIWALHAAVASGRLHPGERLPALREVGDELGVSHNTVRAAVAHLERGGLLRTRHGDGTFVAANPADDARYTALVSHVMELAAHAGLSPRDLAAALYVTEPDVEISDQTAAERRALRSEIALLDRLVTEHELRLGAAPPEPAAPKGRGSRLLSAAELRMVRDDLVGRLVAARTELDAAEATEAATEGQAAKARAGASAPAARVRRPAAQPAR